MSKSKHSVAPSRHPAEPVLREVAVQDPLTPSPSQGRSEPASPGSRFALVLQTLIIAGLLLAIGVHFQAGFNAAAIPTDTAQASAEFAADLSARADAEIAAHPDLRPGDFDRAEAAKRALVEEQTSKFEQLGAQNREHFEHVASVSLWVALYLVFLLIVVVWGRMRRRNKVVDPAMPLRAARAPQDDAEEEDESVQLGEERDAGADLPPSIEPGSTPLPEPLPEPLNKTKSEPQPPHRPIRRSYRAERPRRGRTDRRGRRQIRPTQPRRFRGRKPAL